MKNFISGVLIFFSFLLLLQIFHELNARPGGGGSYRSSSSSSRSSSSSYSRSSSHSSYSSGSYHSSGSGDSLSDEEVKEISGLIFGTVFSIIALVLMTLGLTSNKEEPQTLGTRIGYLTMGFIFMPLGAGLASMSKILIYLYVFVIISIPFIIFIAGIYKLKSGRETIYVAKGESN